jgi:phosphoglucosamine mutase
VTDDRAAVLSRDLGPVLRRTVRDGAAHEAAVVPETLRRAVLDELRVETFVDLPPVEGPYGVRQEGEHRVLVGEDVAARPAVRALHRAVVDAVRAHAADLGIAHDGDADRCLAVDATGAEVDGDQIMAVLAVAMREAGELADDTLVATVMSNLGLHLAMREAGITVRTTAVGDRYVLEELRAGGYSLGGEQSGHVVMPRYSTTGDGLLTALRLMARMAATGRSLADLAAIVTPLPQVLRHVRVADKAAVAGSAAVREAVEKAEVELGGTGRVLLRPSGTEQLVRVMVEAPTAEQAQATAVRLAEVVAAVH